MIDISKIKTAEQKATEAAQAAKQERIAELKQLLRDTDYVTLSDYDRVKPDVLAQRQAWRDEIRALEQTQVG
jgi:ribosomal protein L10